MIETKFKKRIPDGWEVKQLNQVLSLFGRIGFRGYNVTDLVQEGKGAISLSPSNIENGIVTFNKCTYLSWEKYEESPEIMVEEGDILLVKTGSTYGKIGYVESLPWPSTINPQYVVLKKFKCNSRVLAYLLEQKDFQDQIESITSGGAIPTMSQAKILTCTVTLPSKEEQSRIATALSDIDDLIVTTKKLIEKKRNIKEGAMQELLSGKRRLPGFKEKWVEVELGEISDLYQPQTIGAHLFSDYGYAVYGANGVIGHYHKYNHETNQVMITCRGSSCGEVNYSEGKCWINGNAMVVNLDKSDVDKKFIFFYLKRQNFSDTISGSGQPQITRSPLLKYVIWIPKTKDEQSAIAKVLSDMDSEIKSLEARLTKYQSLKQGMMQQLLTGKIRLI